MPRSCSNACADAPAKRRLYTTRHTDEGQYPELEFRVRGLFASAITLVVEELRKSLYEPGFSRSFTAVPQPIRPPSLISSSQLLC